MVITPVVYDIETYIDKERAEKILGSKNYQPDPKLSSLDQVPATITKLKDEVKRAERTEAWKLEQAEKIQKSIESQIEKDRSKCALHWSTGKVVSIVAMAYDEKSEIKGFKSCGHDEKKILTEFNAYLKEINPPAVVGKSNKIFDDGFMVGRLMVNRLPIPYVLRQKDWRDVRDINDIFGFGNRHPQHAKLGEYGVALDLGDKTDSGDNVHEMVENEEWNKLINYNYHDTKLTMDIYKLYCDLCQV